MKERPILFSGPMVRAILAGRKTMTRRVVTPQPTRERGLVFQGLSIGGFGTMLDREILCPYGAPDDRLWVRETFFYSYHGLVYKASNPEVVPGPGWTPSIHMPRWASRITLEVTDVRVERLQDIGEADARAEGCERIHEDHLGQTFTSYRRGFEFLWDSLNAKRPGASWADNPWVWVIGFEMV